MRSILHGLMLALLVLGAMSAWSKADPPAQDKPADKPDPYAVPQGTTQDYVDFLIGLTKVKPANAEEVKKMRAALLEASDKILAGQPDEKQLGLAVGAKVRALDDSADKLAQFAAELKSGGHAQLAHRVRGFSLIRKLQLVHPSSATAKERVAEIVNFLTEEPIEPGMDPALAKVAGQLAEISGDNQFCVETYGKLINILTESKVPAAVNVSKELEAPLRRLTLVGNPMTVEGTVLGGGPFDWSKHEGKVVLVNFFATWCGPCRHEIENIKKTYELYHDKGFDVVAISLDKDQPVLEKFIADEKIPWPVVYGENKPSPTVQYYGISGVPQLILVGKDGKVITLNARGDVLRKELEKLLGPVEEKKTPA